MVIYSFHMSTGIYYFSGTGNSLSVAKDIAAGTGGTLIPIASQVESGAVRVDSDVIGIVFPVYYGELPAIIKRFAEKLENIEQKYIFAVCTFGGSAGYSLKLLRNIIRSRGGDISATYRVHMPQNSFSKPWRNTPSCIPWKKQSRKVVKNTGSRKKGEFFNIFSWGRRSLSLIIA
jgi:flavodoxin